MDNAVLQDNARTLVNLSGGNDHPIVDLPFTAVIDARQFRGRGLSLVAAYVSGLLDPATLNATRIIRLVFQFDGFSVSLVVDAEVRESDRSAGEVELIFIRPTGPHLQQLRHILNAYIAGDLVGLGQTIGVAGTAAPKAQKPDAGPQSRVFLRRFVGGASLALFSIAFLAIAGALTYQRLFVALVPSIGTVVRTGEVMRATTAGQIAFLDLDATKGEVVVAIQSPSGDVQSLVLPCDCSVTSNGLREGSTVLVGEPILQMSDNAMSDTGKELLVQVAISSSMLFDLVNADRIELMLPDGTTAQAVLDTVNTPAGQPAAADTNVVLLRPLVELNAEVVGYPVEVRILRGSLGPFASINLGWSNDASTVEGDNQ